MTPREVLVALARLMIQLLHLAPRADRLFEIARRHWVSEEKSYWHAEWFLRADVAAEYAVEQTLLGHDVYVGVNPRLRMRSGKLGRNRDVAVVTNLPLDFDRRHQQDPEPALGLLHSAGIPPTLVNSSGDGSHLHLRLSEELPVDIGRALARRLHLACGGDPVHAPKQLMRLPGTWNRRRQAWCSIAELHPNRLYTGAQIAAALDAVGVPQVVIDPPVDPVDPIDPPPDVQVLLARLRPDTLRSVLHADGPIVDGVFNRTDGGKKSWSEVDFRVIRRIITEADATDDQIVAVFASFPLGACSARKKPADYLHKTINNARRGHPQARRVPAAVRAPGQLRVELVQRRDGLWVLPPVDLQALDDAVFGPMPDVPPEFLFDRGGDPRSN